MGSFSAGFLGGLGSGMSKGKKKKPAKTQKVSNAPIAPLQKIGSGVRRGARRVIKSMQKVI